MDSTSRSELRERLPLPTAQLEATPAQTMLLLEDTTLLLESLRMLRLLMVRPPGTPEMEEDLNNPLIFQEGDKEGGREEETTKSTSTETSHCFS